jgi:integrase
MRFGFKELRKSPKSDSTEFRKRYPAAITAATGKQHFSTSVGIIVKRQASAAFAQAYAKYEQRVAELRAQIGAQSGELPDPELIPMSVPEQRPVPVTRRAVETALEAWKLAEIGRVYTEMINGRFNLSKDEEDTRSKLCRILTEADRNTPYEDYDPIQELDRIPDFLLRFQTALASHGIHVPKDHPGFDVCRRSFARAWMEVEYFTSDMLSNSDLLSLPPPVQAWLAATRSRYHGNGNLGQLMVSLAPPIQAWQSTIQGGAPVPAQETGLPLLELVEKFLKAPNRRGTRDHTAVNRLRNTARYLVDFIGGDRPVERITRAQVSDFWVECLKFPDHPNRHEKGKSFREIVAMERDPSRCITQQTVVGYANILSACTRWGLKHGQIFVDPVRDNKPVAPDRRATEVTSFHADHLVTLFTSPVFTGDAKSPAWYWIPLILLFTGARLNEIGQLHADDVVWGDVPYFDITQKIKDPKNPRKAQAVKSLKNERWNSPSIRRIPIHPVLLDLGFKDFYKAHARDFVFEDLPHGKRRRDGTVKKPTHQFSKNFGKYLDRIKIDEPIYRLHSFRHLFNQAIERCHVHESRGKYIMGHRRNSKAQENYDIDPELPNLLAEISKIEFSGFPHVERWGCF